MRSLEQNKDLFELLASDGQTWLAQANQLKMAADSILPNVVEAFKIPPALPGAQEKRFAFFHSYMLLTGMAFENLIKGILIQRDKTLVTREQIESEFCLEAGTESQPERRTFCLLRLRNLTSSSGSRSISSGLDVIPCR